jgi:chemotaxis protein MotB
MAVKKKERQVAAGAPAWMVTYGDLVTLLLTFFVMLLAMSEVKKDERYVDFMQAIKAAFGYVGGVRSIPPDFTQIPKNVQLAELLVIPPNPHDLSQSPDEGVRGKRRRVTYIRPGKRFAVGSPVWFPPLSAVLDEAQLAKIAEQAKQLEGHSTLIEVRGHCSRLPAEDSLFEDHADLSYQRARAVSQALVRFRIAPERITLVAAGTIQPVNYRAYTQAEQQQNDLVEILQIDQNVDEFRP